MAETKKLEAMEQEAVLEANAANPQADAPKKNAVAAEPMKKVGEAEDLGPAVTKPTDSNPDASKKMKQVSGDAQQKNQGSADAMPKLKEGSKETADEKEDTKEEEMNDKEDKKKEMKAGYREEVEAEDTLDIKSDVDALRGDSDLA